MRPIPTNTPSQTVTAISPSEYEIDLVCPLFCPHGITTRTGKTRLSFQTGLIATDGVNGITDRALLVVVIDRLSQIENKPQQLETALFHCEQALRFMSGKPACIV